MAFLLPRRRTSPALPSSQPQPAGHGKPFKTESLLPELGGHQQIPLDAERDDDRATDVDTSGKGLHMTPASSRKAAWTVLAIFLGLIVLSYLTSPFLATSTRACGVGLNPPCEPAATSTGKNMRPDDPRDRPYYDLVVAVLVVGGQSIEALAELERVRRVYARYGGWVTPDGGRGGGYQQPLSFRYVFVVGTAGLEKGVEVPVEGLLRGDMFYVEVPEGYRFLSHKTKALMALSEHFSFRFLAKTDGDTFPCLGRVTQQLIEMPVREQPRVYAGLLAECGKVFPPGHKLHDPEFLKATGGVVPCHPMYHQGAFYILGEQIVRHLYRSRELLTVMSVEDAMVGIWLLGIDKVILDIGGHFYCQCFTHPVPRQTVNKQSFYHFCKTDEKVDGCLRKFGTC